MSYYGFPAYVPVAQRRAQAAREIEKLRKKGRTVAPVVIEGRTIVRNFWGKAWCENLERYSDFENRLPRGQTYVRNGSVVDLQVKRGQVRALVMGSCLYKVKIEIGSVPAARWRSIRKDCAGSIGSLVELLSGKLSKNVMERVCRKGDGLFPAPSEIKMSCSCPDGARMCKHLAAALYGAGARLDAMPDLIFALRGVESSELIANAGADLPITHSGGSGTRILADDNLAVLFGVEMAPAPAAPKTCAAKKDVRPAKNAASSKVPPTGQASASAQTATKTSTTKGSTIVSSAAARKKSSSKAGTTKSGSGRAVAEKIEPSGKSIQATTAAPRRPAAPTSASARQEETPSRRRVRTKAARWIKRP
ncbi:hypothetical protein [Rhodoblastus sp.]|uniref:SWIM zinc finger family protein n=1 Tax=Rhodoblastus sp. TaxID=1962975 RepID=UPI003F94B1C5